MDFYQNVVVDYLRADRAIFVNTECCIQLDDGPNPDVCKPHWYCDAVAVDFRTQTVFLCEMSYAEKLGALVDRLKAWSAHWPKLHDALKRDCTIPDGWPVRPWLFVPEESVQRLVQKLELINGPNGMLIFQPRITTLEMVQPWRYRSWNHRDQAGDKPLTIPEAMRS